MSMAMGVPSVKKMHRLCEYTQMSVDQIPGFRLKVACTDKIKRGSSCGSACNNVYEESDKLRQTLQKIGPLHDPVTWYKITRAGEQVAQW